MKTSVSFMFFMSLRTMSQTFAAINLKEQIPKCFETLSYNGQVLIREYHYSNRKIIFTLKV